MSTERRGKLKIVKLIAVPPFNARLSFNIGLVLKYSKISESLVTFSYVSRIKPSSSAFFPK